MGPNKVNLRVMEIKGVAHFIRTGASPLDTV